MAYDNPGAMGGGESAGEEMHSPAMHEGGEDMGVLHVSADMLPKGMKVKKGDILEFRATGDTDADGDTPVEYNMGEESDENPGDKETKDAPMSWEDDLRHEMSPRAPDAPMEH